MSDRKPDFRKVDRVLEELHGAYEGTNYLFVLLEVGKPISLVPGLDPERELGDWEETGERAVKQLNTAFADTPLRFSCSAVVHKPVLEYREIRTPDRSVTDWRVVCDCGCKFVGRWSGAVGPIMNDALEALGCEPDNSRDAWRLVPWDHSEPNYDGVGLNRS